MRSDLPVVRIVCCPLADVLWQGDLHWDDIERADNPTAVLQSPTCVEVEYYMIRRKPKALSLLKNLSAHREGCAEATMLLLKGTSTDLGRYTGTLSMPVQMQISPAELLRGIVRHIRSTQQLENLTCLTAPRRTTCCRRMRLGKSAEYGCGRGERIAAKAADTSSSPAIYLCMHQQRDEQGTVTTAKIVLDREHMMHGTLEYRSLPDRRAHLAMRHSSNVCARSHAIAVTRRSEYHRPRVHYTRNSPRCVAGLHAPARP